MYARKLELYQPRTQASFRYPSDQRRLEPSAIARGRPRRIFPTSLIGDVTSEIAEDGWEPGGIYTIYRYFNCFKHFPINEKRNKNTY